MAIEPSADSEHPGVVPPSPDGTFARPMLTEQIVEHLTRNIADGVWPPLTMLPPEAELTRQLGVSRTVLRESVRVLSSRGMLRVQRGRGTFVAPPAEWNVTEPLALLVRADRAELLNWLEVRAILEVSSAGLAAQRANADDREALSAALKELQQAEEDPAAYVAADVAFHLAVADATHNPQLRLLLRPLLQPLREQLTQTALITKAVSAAKREHRRIASAVLEGSEDAARDAMQRHLSRVAGEIQVVSSRRAQPRV